MKYLSLFSGIGGFELGIEQAYGMGIKSTDKESKQTESEIQFGGKRPSMEVESSVLLTNNGGIRPICIGYSEIDKYAIQIYEKHFKHKNYGNITKIDERRLPSFDLICGGFPCQSFSIAGKRGGFEDTRGTLFFDIARIIKAKRPRLLFLENVKGLLSHDEGRTFNTIILTLDELGYDIQWQVLNSKNFGVPQNRERVFIIGHLRGTSGPKVFPIFQANKISKGTYQERYGNFGGKTTTPDGYADTLTKSYGELSGDGTKIIQLNQPKHSNNRVYGTDGISPTLNTAQGGNRQPFIPEDSKIRRLTPTECERLQGFPDGWTEGVSDTQRYKTLGNAVTVNVIQSIMEKLC